MYAKALSHLILPEPKKNSFILVLLFLAVNPVFSNRVIDSLRAELHTQTVPGDRHRLAMQLATVYGRHSLDSSLSYARQALQIAESSDMPLQAAQAMGLIAYVALYEGRMDSAQVYYQAARDRYTEIPDTLGIVQAEMNLANVDYYKGNYQQGIERLLEALRLSNLQPEGEGKNKNLASILNNLGAYYEAWDEDSLALVYYRQALRLKRVIAASDPANINFDLPVARTLNNMGGIFSSMGKYDSANVYFQESLNIHKSEVDQAGLARTYQALAELYILQHQYNQAEPYQQEAWARDQEIGEKPSLTADMQNWATIRKGQGRITEARQWALKAWEMARNVGIPHDEVGSLQLLAEIAEEQQEWQQAVEYWNQYRTLKDSLFNEEFKEETTRLTQLYESERKDNDILRLTQEAKIRELSLTRRSQQLLFLAILAGLLVAVAGLIYNRYRIKRQSERQLSDKNQQLHELNTTKDKLFSIIAHDLRNPLSSFQSLSNSLEQQVFDLNREEMQQLLKRMKSSSTQLYDLLQNLLKWAMSQTGRLSFEPRIQRLSKIFDRVMMPLTPEIEAKHIAIQSDFDPTLMVWADRDMLDIILRNILSNAVKFTPVSGNITLSGKETDEGVAISIADSGVGLTQQEADRLFQPGEDVRKIGTHPAKGTGLGLQLCQELILRHGGSISAHPGTENGAIFTLFFPHDHA